MVAIGLVPELTAKAARQASLGAGAKVLKTYSYELTEKDLQEIDQTAQERIELLIDQLLENEPAPEKEKDPIGWAAHMNMLHQIAEETVLSELIYS